MICSLSREGGEIPATESRLDLEAAIVDNQEEEERACPTINIALRASISSNWSSDKKKFDEKREKDVELSSAAHFSIGVSGGKKKLFTHRAAFSAIMCVSFQSHCHVVWTVCVSAQRSWFALHTLCFAKYTDQEIYRIILTQSRKNREKHYIPFVSNFWLTFLLL